MEGKNGYEKMCITDFPRGSSHISGSGRILLYIAVYPVGNSTME